MSEVLMTLGTIRFSIEEGSYQALTRTLEMVVARQARAGRQAARQVLGEDETVEIEGVVYPAFRGGLDRVDSFRALARTYKAAMLTDGTGKVWGEFVVERVEEQATNHLPNGAPQRQAFRISLGAAGGDA